MLTEHRWRQPVETDEKARCIKGASESEKTVNHCGDRQNRRRLGDEVRDVRRARSRANSSTSPAQSKPRTTAGHSLAYFPWAFLRGDL